MRGSRVIGLGDVGEPFAVYLQQHYHCVLVLDAV